MSMASCVAAGARAGQRTARAASGTGAAHAIHVPHPGRHVGMLVLRASDVQGNAQRTAGATAPTRPARLVLRRSRLRGECASCAPHVPAAAPAGGCTAARSRPPLTGACACAAAGARLDDRALVDARAQADDRVGDHALLQVGAVADDGVADARLHDLGRRQEARRRVDRRLRVVELEARRLPAAHGHGQPCPQPWSGPLPSYAPTSQGRCLLGHASPERHAGLQNPTRLRLPRVGSRARQPPTAVDQCARGATAQARPAPAAPAPGWPRRRT